MKACPTEEMAHQFLSDLPPMETVPVSQVSASPQEVSHTAGHIKVLNLNAGMLNEAPGVHVPEDKSRRAVALAEHLRTADYDVVILQELWHNKEYNLLQGILPFSTRYGNSDSTLCPQVGQDREYIGQTFFFDCHGLAIFSRFKMTDIKFDRS